MYHSCACKQDYMHYTTPEAKGFHITGIKIGWDTLTSSPRLDDHFAWEDTSRYCIQGSHQEQIACLGLGSRWPPNGRQLCPLLNHLPQYGIYRCQRSQATRAAAFPPPPPTVETWKQFDRWYRWLRRTWFSYFSFVIRFSFSHWLLSQCIRLALKNWYSSLYH